MLVETGCHMNLTVPVAVTCPTLDVPERKALDADIIHCVRVRDKVVLLECINGAKFFDRLRAPWSRKKATT